ncbi:MAG TPA: hypothetical protein PLM79_14080 [Syntrophobacteraceae bacterium]|nr:hypothetical protein [Syntrophobacteraceae bacterium]
MKDFSLTQVADLLPPGEIWVLGLGKFGMLAWKRLEKRFPRASFVLVEEREEKTRGIQERGSLKIVARDAIGFLLDARVPGEVWIIPAVPVHAAFRWLLGRLEPPRAASSIPLPREIDPRVPNPLRSGEETIYTSFAAFVCPDGCDEPDEICTYTKKARPGNLYEELSRLEIPGFRTHVLRSLQLAPGVGGYPGRSLEGLHEEVLKTPGNHLVATSCRCHGVINALNWRETGA